MLSYFLPRVITLVKDPNPVRVSIDGCKRGKNASSFRQVLLLLFAAHRKFFSSCSTSSVNYFSPIFCCHSCAKSMCIFSFTLMWLICSFHFCRLFIVFRFLTCQTYKNIGV
jgi:hypothetical protein